MIDAGYPWGDAFQIRLLAMLLKYPDKVLGIVEPSFFTDPITTDIAKIITDIHKQPEGKGIKISKATLKELVKASLGKKEEHWLLYRKIIRRLYKTELRDSEVLLDQAKEFARETRHRDALVKAERSISAGKYGDVYKIFEKLSAFESSGGTGPWKWEDLPLYSEFPIQPISWLVEDLIPAKSIVAVSGDEGVGKTLFALHLAKALAEGVSHFLGRRVCHTNVLYLGLDVSQATLQGYIEAMKWEPNKHFRFMTMWTGEDKQPPMFDDLGQVARLYDLVKKSQPLIILDTLRDFFDGEENSSTDTKPVVDALRKLRALGATFILLVHPTKRGKSAIRGTGNIAQKTDIVYTMEKDEQRAREIVCLTAPKKNRFGSTRFRLVFRYLFVPTRGGLRIIITAVEETETPSKQRRDTSVSKVIEFVTDHPGTNQEEIKGALGMGDRKLKNVLSDAEESGKLKVEPGQGKEKLWSVNESLTKELA